MGSTHSHPRRPRAAMGVGGGVSAARPRSEPSDYDGSGSGSSSDSSSVADSDGGIEERHRQRYKHRSDPRRRPSSRNFDRENDGSSGYDESSRAAWELSSSASSLQTASAKHDSRRDMMNELAVIQSSRSLRPDELHIKDADDHNDGSDAAIQPFDAQRYTNSRSQSQTLDVPPLVSDNTHDVSASPSFEDAHGSFSYPPPATTIGYRRQSNGIMDDSLDGSSFTSLHNPLLTPFSAPAADFFPQGSRRSEWMGRSIETLILGHRSVAPILCLPEDEDDFGDEASLAWGALRRRSTVSTLGSDFGPRSSLGSFVGSRRGSLVGGGHAQGGTLANYINRRRQQLPQHQQSQTYSQQPSTELDRGFGSRRGSAASSRRGSASHGPSYRRRMSVSRSNSDSDEYRPHGNGGPNIALTLLARESAGLPRERLPKPQAHRLKDLGGHTLFTAIDGPAGGMCSEVAFLSDVIDSGDWAEAQAIISRISPRLIGDLTMASQNRDGLSAGAQNDPNLPPSTSRFYAGGGRLGLERDAFVMAGGINVFVRVFRETSFVGEEMARSHDARDLNSDLVSARFAACWNEVLASLRELVYAIPSLVDDDVLGDEDFLPFLFTLLSHDSCFDGAAVLIEEILSLQSQSPIQVPIGDDDDDDGGARSDFPGYGDRAGNSPATTFFLGSVPDLYKLWGGFNPRQLSCFCRVLALLVFEPEDRQLLSSPAALKSIELLQLRRNRAVRAGRDCNIDMNQSILLNDVTLMTRLLALLQVMNYSPPLRRSSSYHVISAYPFIADTLMMLGLNELQDWNEIYRLNAMAQELVDDPDDEGDYQSICSLGCVSEMLESLSRTLLGHLDEPTGQLGHIGHIINAAQDAGIIGGGQRRRSGRDARTNSAMRSGSSSSATTVNVAAGGAMPAGTSNGDQVFVGRIHTAGSSNGQPNAVLGRLSSSQLANVDNPNDAANILQFNALLLGPYQVEVLFILCTLLGGRRKLDAQKKLCRLGIVNVLDEMFQRFPWHSLSPSRKLVPPPPLQDTQNLFGSNMFDEEQPNGIHGPGCECTPESALCVQYLRLVNSVSDRDCDNYAGRTLLLSADEQEFILEHDVEMTPEGVSNLTPGLLSKIIAAFIKESDESSYRFWMASCIESFLRGSSSTEQIFVANTGLLNHLVKDITSERLHCIGSLQTSFDLLGELCKGNSDILHLLVADLDEWSFRKLMSTAAANLVDSNVFIRSLLLSLERIASSSTPFKRVGERKEDWGNQLGQFPSAFLSHTWIDTKVTNMNSQSYSSFGLVTESAFTSDSGQPSDWYLPSSAIEAFDIVQSQLSDTIHTISSSYCRTDSVEWIYTPNDTSMPSSVLQPNTIERLHWFLVVNQSRLLADLLRVVDLTCINHENICCLNTAVITAILAHRRNQLPELLLGLRKQNRSNVPESVIERNKSGEALTQAQEEATALSAIDGMIPVPYSRQHSLSRSLLFDDNTHSGNETDLLQNFREVLWFWLEYYSHRGRDRLSLEFSSHLRYQEWLRVILLLTADDDSPTSLVNAPVCLPRSPYHRLIQLV